MLISKEKLQIAKYAKEARGALDTKYLYLDGDKAYATNGHYLLQVTGHDSERGFPSGIDKGSLTGEPYVPKRDFVAKETARKVLQNIPKHPYPPAIGNARLWRMGNALLFRVTDLETELDIRQVIVDADYPDVESLWPSDPTHVTDVDPGYLLEIVKAANEFSKEATVKISTGDLGGGNPSLILSVEKEDNGTTKTFKAILMPREEV